MAEYTQSETAEVARQAEIAASAMAASREARGFSDDYVLLTVVLASVLLFLGTLVALTTMPICHE